MGEGAKLSGGDFLRDIRLVVTSPAHRFAVIRERGASWGSLLLLIAPTYLGLSYVSGVYFARDPFPGYSLIPPMIVAVAAVYLKLYLIHNSARILQGRRRTEPGHGSFSDLRVVFGYTGVPSILAILLAAALFLLIPEEMGYAIANFRAISISIMVALGLALFIWNLILVVLALRTVYPMRDLKLLAAFILGSVLVALPAICTMWVVAPADVNIAYVQPIVSEKLLRFLASEPTSATSSTTKVSIHVDKLTYHLRTPERFEIVAFLPKYPKPKESGQGATVTFGSRSMIWWGGGDLAVGRIVGLPGDKVELVKGNLRINGQAWDERYLAPEYSSVVSLPLISLGPSEYLVLPENRHLIGEMKDELVVDQDQICGREIIDKWPLGWWVFRPTVFLQAQPASSTAIR
jgi:hypothetical protein